MLIADFSSQGLMILLMLSDVDSGLQTQALRSPRALWPNPWTPATEL